MFNEPNTLQWGSNFNFVVNFCDVSATRKGIVNPEEYKKHQIQAAQLVENRVNEQMEQYKKNNSKIFDVLNNLGEKSNHLAHSKNEPVVS